MHVLVIAFQAPTSESQVNSDSLQAFNKDVTLIVSDLKGPWWFRGPPRESFVGPFTRHPIRLMGRARDADGNRQGVECFSQLIVGLKHNLCLYNEWGGKETRNEVRVVSNIPESKSGSLL